AEGAAADPRLDDHGRPLTVEAVPRGQLVQRRAEVIAERHGGHPLRMILLDKPCRGHRRAAGRDRSPSLRMIDWTSHAEPSLAARSDESQSCRDGLYCVTRCRGG